MTALSDRDLAVLALERQQWRYSGSKEQAIKDQFGVSATTYYQWLRNLIDQPEALAADPTLINRLRRLRDERARARSARGLARGPA